MKILLTGATGYIAQRLLPVLLQNGHEVLHALGYKKVSALKSVEKATKLHQELCGYNKKNKLGFTNPSQEEVARWIE